MRKVLYILGELEESDLQWMVSVGRARRVPTGEEIVREGTSLDTLFILADGQMAVSLAGSTVARLGAGEVFGDMSLLDSRPPTATVSAASDSIVFGIPHTLLRAKLKSDPPFAARFYRALCIFLANRLGKTTSIAAQQGVNLPQDEDQSEPELSPELLDNVSLAGARFDWFLDRIKER